MAKKPLHQVHLTRIREELIAGKTMYEVIWNLQNGLYDWFKDSADKSGSYLTKLVKEALDTCQYESMIARDQQKGLHLERYLDLYRTCLAANDRSTARAVLSDIAKLMGLNSPSQIQLEQTNYRVKLV